MTKSRRAGDKRAELRQIEHRGWDAADVRFDIFDLGLEDDYDEHGFPMIGDGARAELGTIDCTADVGRCRSHLCIARDVDPQVRLRGWRTSGTALSCEDAAIISPTSVLHSFDDIFESFQ